MIHHLCNISRGWYVYKQDLQALSGPPPISSASLLPVPPLQLLSRISTPLQVHACMGHFAQLSPRLGNRIIHPAGAAAGLLHRFSGTYSPPLSAESQKHAFSI